MKHRLDTPTVFAYESGGGLRKKQIVARFRFMGIVVVGTIVVALLTIGASPLGPDLPGLHSSASGDDHRSVTPESPPGDGDHPADDVSPAASEAPTTPTPKPSPTPSATTPTPTPTAESSKDPKSIRSRPSHDPGTPPTSPPGKEKE